jgi:putative DNA modification/repair radical SAM protein
VNRNSSNVERARFTVAEVVQLTLGFYRRNFIEGLFLSSGIIRSPDYTMEQLAEVARLLREEHQFRGYIHLKTIPDAAPELIERAGRHADRLSVNIELPSDNGLQRLAPQKSGRTIRKAMAETRLKVETAAAEPRGGRFAPAGQSTQMVIGADGADDAGILETSTELYGAYRLRRVYYAAYSPIPDASSALPPRRPPLMREHRLYQADWLMRVYGFALAEVLEGARGGMLDLDIDPKLAWALQHRDRFPIDVNAAPREALLRVPGLGVRTVSRILQVRRLHRLREADLGRLGVRLTKVRPFIHTAERAPKGPLLDALNLRERLQPPVQPDLFAAHG